MDINIFVVIKKKIIFMMEIRLFKISMKITLKDSSMRIKCIENRGQCPFFLMCGNKKVISIFWSVENYFVTFYFFHIFSNKLMVAYTAEFTALTKCDTLCRSDRQPFASSANNLCWIRLVLKDPYSGLFYFGLISIYVITVFGEPLSYVFNNSLHHLTPSFVWAFMRWGAI